MKRIFIVLGVVLMVLLTACTVKNTDDLPRACTEEAKICPDGSTVGRDPNNNCEFSPCLVDGKNYVSTDPEECKLIKFMCIEGKQPFFDENGCGCEPITDGKLQAIDCPAERPTICTKEYMPVCGQVQVQCIKEPCPPIKQTFGNKCEACANSLTISYTDRACEKTNSELQVDCTSIGGNWLEDPKECTGINAEQCTSIGGTFNECASACRNNPNAEVCTMQCVQVCEFKV